MLTTEEIREYQWIHEKVHWFTITENEALESGTKLVTFLETIFKH